MAQRLRMEYNKSETKSIVRAGALPIEAAPSFLYWVERRWNTTTNEKLQNSVNRESS